MQINNKILQQLAATKAAANCFLEEAIKLEQMIADVSTSAVAPRGLKDKDKILINSRLRKRFFQQ
jgi:hypothetical protein